MTAKGFKQASLDWKRSLSAKDVWSFQCLQRRKIFVHEDQSVIKEDVVDMQALMPKEGLLRCWNTNHGSVVIGSTYELNVHRLKKTGKALTLQ